MRGWEQGSRGVENMMGFGGFGFFEWLGPIFMVLLLAAVVVGVIFLVRGLRSQPSPPPVAAAHGVGAVAAGWSAQAPAPAVTGSVGALTILEERFARGDIDREEFLQRRNDLISQPGAATE